MMGPGFSEELAKQVGCYIVVALALVLILGAAIALLIVWFCGGFQ